MKVSECMSPDVRMVGPNDTLQHAAQMMESIDAGILPVSDGDRLVGMITDRDIAIRGVAHGRGPDAPVSEVMSREVMYCYQDEDIHDVLRNMGDIKVRRLAVVSRDKRLVGIVSLSDMATGGGRPPTAEALHQIATPGGPHSQTRH